MSFSYEDGHCFYGTEETQFSSWTSPFYTDSNLGGDDVHDFYETEEAQFSTFTSSFYTDQVFRSREDMMNWVKHTAYSLGYVIVTKSSKQCKNGFTNKLVLRCDRGGNPRGSGSTTNSGSIKINCPFKLIAKYSLEHHYWTIRVVCDQHNHLPTKNLEGHAYARRLSKDEFRLVEDLTSKNVPPREILSMLKDQDENNLSTIETIYEAQKKIRRNEKGEKTPMQFLMSVLQFHRYVYEPYTHPVTNELQALFFVHPTSYDIWRAFPHVLIIDATYKTNIYKMPFVQIVGVTSTGNTFCVAFVFISEEKMSNYKWVLEQLKLTLNECMQPRVIVTDRELALMKACEIVFPHATHLLCRWHIWQNIVKNCKQSVKSKYDWKLFKSAWKALINSPTWISYEENYKHLRTLLLNYPRVSRYVHENWLDKYKNHFVSASIDKCLHFRNYTTNRAESQHAKLKNYMEHKSYTLDKFVICLNKIVKSQLTAIKKSFGRSGISRYHKHNMPCFSLLWDFVSKKALDLLVNEINRLNDSQLDSSTCDCKLHSSCGLPCACRLSSYINCDECVPLDAIDIFWRTLNISPAKSSDHISCETEINQFKEHFNKQSEPGKKSFIRKLVDIFNASKTTMKAPTVKRNNRGRPSLKQQQQQQKQQQQKQKQQQQKRNDPLKNSQSSRFFGVDLNVETERHSSYTSYQTNYDRDPIPDLNEEPTRHSLFVEPTRHSLFMDLNEEPDTFFDYIPETNQFVPPTVDSHSFFVDLNEEPVINPLLYHIPDIFHRYIILLNNVEGDGNCGFRSVAVGLGRDENMWPLIRQELLQELRYHEHDYMEIFTFIGFKFICDTVNFSGTGFALEDKWMSMPDTGLVIASFYRRPVVFISMVGNDILSSTCFPLWSGPHESESTKPIVVARAGGRHFINLLLREGYPIPSTHPQWRRYKVDRASAWEDMYSDRQRAFDEYIRSRRQMY